MKILFFLVHPAHYHLFKHVIRRLLKEGHDLKILIVTKDVLEDLVKSEGWEYLNLVPEGRRSKSLPILVNTFRAVVKTEIRLCKFVRKHKPDMLAGTEMTLAHIGWLLHIPSYIFNEDNTSATPENYLFYPFATRVIMPECCDVGKWKKKRVTYNGYHELAYLHPNYFTPDMKVIRNLNTDGERYFILRLADLSASHDIGKTGITAAMAEKIITILQAYGKAYITAEGKLPARFEQHRLSVKPEDIFHVLASADLYIGDSQTMAAEAAVLGTPSIRYNDFVGKLGYLEELEKKYGLTRGVPASEPERLYDTIEEFLNMPNLKKTMHEKRQAMLTGMTDVSEWMVQYFKSEHKSFK
ncbi:DUF354 domain-containing protein [Fibrobacterota bacterium]